MTSSDPGKASRTGWRVAPDEDIYQALTTEEDRARTNVHYEQPPRFFTAFTGGEWNTYSCNLWDHATSVTESQEAKLDLLARHMQLAPGMRIMDVGCGWGGPLAYLCQRYRVRGVGLTLSPRQAEYARERIARHRVEARVVECHWRDYEDPETFDAIYTDEVIVHFHDLSEFFARCHALLRPAGRLVNKELHFTHPSYARLTRSTYLIQQIYGYTGNYRTLADELGRLHDAGFETAHVESLPHRHYGMTMKHWLANLHAHREELVHLVGPAFYLRFRKYLKVARMWVTSRTCSTDVVVAHKLPA
ncbi:MAG TPA: class I SAM-dependent methyltransferase [Methylomirabilota bacterium]|nr:class I SAM-dependent methyltransferase [Methylomirabilota bacterium]